MPWISTHRGTKWISAHTSPRRDRQAIHVVCERWACPKRSLSCERRCITMSLFSTSVSDHRAEELTTTGGASAPNQVSQALRSDAQLLHPRPRRRPGRRGQFPVSRPPGGLIEPSVDCAGAAFSAPSRFVGPGDTLLRLALWHVRVTRSFLSQHSLPTRRGEHQRGCPTHRNSSPRQTD